MECRRHPPLPSTLPSARSASQPPPPSAAKTSLNFPDVATILKTNIRTVTHIPKRYRGEIALEFAKALRSATWSSNEAGWRDLFWFSKCLLSLPRRGGKRTQSLQQRVKNSLELWRTGYEGKLELWNRAPRFTKN